MFTYVKCSWKVKDFVLISKFLRVLNVLCFLLGNSPASEIKFGRLQITQKEAYNKRRFFFFYFLFFFIRIANNGASKFSPM